MVQVRTGLSHAHGCLQVSRMVPACRGMRALVCASRYAAMKLFGVTQTEVTGEPLGRLLPSHLKWCQEFLVLNQWMHSLRKHMCWLQSLTCCS